MLPSHCHVLAEGHSRDESDSCPETGVGFGRDHACSVHVGSPFKPSLNVLIAPPPKTDVRVCCSTHFSLRC